ncbi:hypothetical protein ACO0LL_26190 [Undibacterium sp. TC4M20W]|uniref:hypothetical protein n=1 Tax=Undibacterium sp. TC4M20W TaxID=3413052 RepID=UPI003BF3A63C
MRFVVDDLISSLNAERVRQLNILILNHQIKESWLWYDEVISRYLQSPDSAELIGEIDALFPDESTLKLIETSTVLPVFEAKVILREAQNLLRSSAADSILVSR